VEIVRANKYRLYPNAKQKSILHDYFGASRFVFNQLLGKIKNNHFGTIIAKNGKEYSRIPAQTELINELPKLKEEYSFLKGRSNDLMQSSLSDLYIGCKNFYNGSGFPKFKSRKNLTQSFEMKAGCRIQLKDNFIILPKPREGNYSSDDLTIKFKFHETNLDLPEKLIKYTISKDNLKQYWISFTFKSEVEDDKREIQKAIGLDLGIKDLVICSDGTSIGNQKLTKKSAKKLKYCQKQLSRRKKSGQNRKKSRIRVAKIHDKIKNQRNYRNHQISRQLVNENDFISMESLKIKNMMKNRKLSKSIADASWFDLITKIKYKMTEKQGHFYQINQWFPSTKTCSSCGNKKKISLDERIYFCDICGMEKDRDINASINIMKQGLKELGMNPPELYKIKPFV
jgi:putative transposase